MKKILTQSLFALALVATAPLTSFGDVLVSDNFALNGTTRLAGTSLQGLAPEFEANTGYSYVLDYGAFAQLGASGGVVNTTPGASMGFYIGFTAPTDRIFSAEATTTFGGPGTIDRYVINFSTINPLNQYGDVSAYIYNNGNIQLLTDQGSKDFGDFSIPGFSTANTYALTLNYNPVDGSASVLLNGVSVIAPVVVGNYAIGYAGVVEYDPTASGSALLSHFEVTAVPEPSVIGLSVLGLGFVLFFARRRAARLA